MRACRTTPEKGIDTFNKLKKDVGYAKAVTIFNKITGSMFNNMYGDSITLDSDGVPTYESIIKLPIIREYIGTQTIIDNLNKTQPHLEDNSENVAFLINKAQDFNNSDTHKDLIAIVDYDDEDKITLNIVSKTEETVETAVAQEKIYKLNSAAASILRDAGITIESLSQIEKAVGRVGVTEFKHLSKTLDEFEVVVRVANNLEGFNAISEELAHVIIGVNKDNPLVQRSLNYFRNENNAREILGNQYDKVFEYYNGDTEKIAEEAAGHIFRDALLDRINNKSTTKVPLFKRMFESVLETFKGINPAYYKDTLDSIRYEFGELAQKYLSGEKKITKKDIQEARREASFNALSKKIDAQIQVLRELTTDEYKNSTLQRELSTEKVDNKRVGNTKKNIMKGADLIKAIVDKAEISGESMKAIVKVVDRVNKNMNLVLNQLDIIDKLPLQDRFKVLRNALTMYKAYSKMLDNIDVITSQEFTSDEEIKLQDFMIDDSTDALADYRNEDGIESIDTSAMTIDEILQLMEKDSEDWELSEDKTHYVNKSGRKAFRVTSTIEATDDVEPINPNNPYNTPSTNIGTGVDELVRDFFSGRLVEKDGKWSINGKPLDEVYPNADNDSLNEFCNQLKELKAYFAARGITIVARDIKAVGTIDTVDGAGNIHKVNDVGTLDLLGYDKNGNFYIYDMKTHRGDIDFHKKKKWSKQLSLYKKFLEKRYGIKIKSTSIIPISVSYPKPFGVIGGLANYSVSKEAKPADYKGEENNQLLIDDEKFKGAKPRLHDRDDNRILRLKETEFDVNYSTLADDPTNGMGKGYDVLKNTIKDSRELLSDINREFKEKSKPEFVKFLASFIGETVEVADPNNPGKFKRISIEELIKDADVDITWMQKMLATMADVPNTLLQAFDKIIKDKKHQKRVKTIDMAQRITALGIKYEKRGIRDYGFMFEEDKINYINKYFNKTAYDKDYKTFSEELEKKYGNPPVGSAEYKAKKNELLRWLGSHTIKQRIDGRLQNIPDPNQYPSKYESLSDAQKDLYDEWMELKEEIDLVIGKDKTTLTNSIKIRKSGIERLRGAMSGKAITELIEKAKASVTKSYDDEASYARGIRDIEGNEHMVVPLLYLNIEGSGRDISTDIIGTLIAYADMAYNYEAMNDVVDALEIGKQVVLNNTKIHRRKRGKILKEVFTPRGQQIETDVTINTETSNIMEAITNLLESKVYERHQKQLEDFYGMDLNKATSMLTRLGSAVQLGFNFFANVANLVSGLGMSNIEAIAHEYFTPSALRKADKLYFAHIGPVINDMYSRTKFSKYYLISELFDMKLEHSKDIRHESFTNRNLLTRIFGPAIQFIGQRAGDHWLYHRAAWAYLDTHARLKLNGHKIDLFDAYDVVPIDPTNPEAGNKVVLKEGITNEDGTPFTEKDIARLTGGIWEMNKKLFGVYNTEDTIEARRYIIGKLGMQYRDWMPPLYRHRFGKASSSLEGGRNSEGFYRTTGRFAIHLIKDLQNGQMNIAQSWNDLEEHEQANVRRAIAETAQLIMVTAIAALLKGDPKLRPWAMRAISMLFTRGRTELGALHPLGVWSEGRKLLNSPFAATSVLDDIDNLKTLLMPHKYFDEIQSGDFKGHSSAYRAFIKSPATLWFNTLRKHLSPERAENYYDD